MERNPKIFASRKKWQARSSLEIAPASDQWDSFCTEHRDWLAIGLRGSVDQVQAITNEVQAMRGVTHGHLSAVPTDAWPVSNR